MFLTVDFAPPANAPANLHGLVFDEAQAGYLAGVVAVAYGQAGHVAMVGDGAADLSTQNYLAGFRAGATEGNQLATVAVAYAGAADVPEKARAAVDSLVKGGSSVVLAMPGLSGVAAIRETCARKAYAIGAGTDAWQLVPDAQSCLIASAVKRYDTSVAAAIVNYASGAPMPRTSMGDVASGGIALTDFHIPAPAGLQARIDSILAVMRAAVARPSLSPASS